MNLNLSQPSPSQLEKVIAGGKYDLLVYLQGGGDPNRVIKFGLGVAKWSLLGYAIYTRQSLLVTLLLKYGANPNQVGEQFTKKYPLDLVDDPETAKLLLEYGATQASTTAGTKWVTQITNITPATYSHPSHEHPLIVSEHIPWRCNECRELVLQYQCRPCNYDLCRACFQRQTVTPIIRMAPVDSNALSSVEAALLACPATISANSKNTTLYTYLMQKMKKEISSPAEQLLVSQTDMLISSDKLGQGSMGTVFKGTYKGIPVAIKDPKHSITFNATKGDWAQGHYKEMWLREISISSHISHPNLVSTIGVSEQPPLLIMSLESQSLRKLVQCTVHEGYIFTLSGIVAVGLDIALGMNYLHLCGWAHRDMNLGNFLVSEDWHVKVSDFGVGKFMGDIDSSLTAGPGASAFRAPETTEQSYGLACDIWSFAVILSKLFLSDDVLFIPEDPDEPSWITNEEAQSLAQFIGRGNLRHFSHTRELILANVPAEARCLKSLLSVCLQLSPSIRPNFWSIINQLYQLQATGLNTGRGPDYWVSPFKS
jgi:hypothetical protein